MFSGLEKIGIHKKPLTMGNLLPIIITGNRLPECRTERMEAMKTLILYATKHGAAREIARRIADRMDGAVLHDLEQADVPALDLFDCVIVGSSLYAGMIRKEAKAFLSQNADRLREKKLGLFLSGMDASREKAYFDANCPPDVLKAAKAAAFLGGVFDPKKTGAMERFIMKAVAKQKGYSNIISDEKIKQFVEAMKE